MAMRIRSVRPRTPHPSSLREVSRRFSADPAPEAPATQGQRERGSRCRRALLALAALALLPLLGIASGCTQRVVGASGIGASAIYPTVSEPTPTDRLTDFVWGPRDPAPVRGQY